MPAAPARIRPSALLGDSAREPRHIPAFLRRGRCILRRACVWGTAYGGRHDKKDRFLPVCPGPAAGLCLPGRSSGDPYRQQALGGSLALRYLRTDGVWVTKGWVNFGPHSKQTVTLETWEPVFYLHVEVGGGASVELPGEKHRFWVVRDVFELEGDARPARGQQADFIKVEVRGDDPRFTLRF